VTTNNYLPEVSEGALRKMKEEKRIRHSGKKSLAQGKE